MANNKKDFFGHLDLANIGGTAINGIDARQGKLSHQIGEANYQQHGTKGSPGMSSRKTRRALASANRRGRKVIHFKV